jgi:spore coat polysaccharide biosynthesis protein SpsF (cytidylyltransferase family)
MIKNFLNYSIKRKIDYSSNCAPYEKRTYPVGSDIEIFKFSELEKYKIKKTSLFQREHISPFFLKNSKKKHLFNEKNNLSMIRYTLDYKEDLVLLKHLSSKFKNPIKVKYAEITTYLKKNIKISSINSKYVGIYYKKKIKKGY